MKTQQYISLTEASFPNTLDLEKEVIAGLVSFKWLYFDSGVTEEMFTAPTTQRMFSILNQMMDEGVDINVDTYVRRLANEEERMDIGPRIICHKGIAQAKADISELKTIALRRRIYYGITDLLSDAIRGGKTDGELTGSVLDFAQGITTDFVPKKDISLPEEFNAIAESLQELAATGKSNRITTGYPDLDKILAGGFAPGQLIILAARPSAGKTAMMLQLALNASRDGRSVQIYSLEMTGRELAERYLISVGALDQRDLATGEVDWSRFEERSKFFDKLPIAIDDRARTLTEIVSSITLKAKRKEIDIAFIDYLGYIVTEDSKQPLYQRLGEVTGSLKATARKLGIPIVLLCQLNRETAKGNRSPELYDLRDSGSIEQDADIVMMLQRVMDDETSELAPGLYMFVRKNRRGMIMDKHIRFIPDDNYTTFTWGGIGIPMS